MRKSYTRVLNQYTVSSFFPASLPATQANIDQPATNLRTGDPVSVVHCRIISAVILTKINYPKKSYTLTSCNNNVFYTANHTSVTNATCYAVMVNGAYGDITSPPAVLTFNQPGSITVQPVIYDLKRFRRLITFDNQLTAL